MPNGCECPNGTALDEEKNECVSQSECPGMYVNCANYYANAVKPVYSSHCVIRPPTQLENPQIRTSFTHKIPFLMQLPTY